MERILAPPPHCLTHLTSHLMPLHLTSHSPHLFALHMLLTCLTHHSPALHHTHTPFPFCPFLTLSFHTFFIVIHIYFQCEKGRQGQGQDQGATSAEES